MENQYRERINIRFVFAVYVRSQYHEPCLGDTLTGDKTRNIPNMFGFLL